MAFDYKKHKAKKVAGRFGNSHIYHLSEVDIGRYSNLALQNPRILTIADVDKNTPILNLVTYVDRTFEVRLFCNNCCVVTDSIHTVDRMDHSYDRTRMENVGAKSYLTNPLGVSSNRLVDFSGCAEIVSLTRICPLSKDGHPL